jgi:hypothetical protein
MTTYGDVITRSYAEIGVARAGDVLAPESMQLGIDTLLLLLDQWNLRPSASYDDAFQTFVLTPSLQPHTIGIAANAPTWSVAVKRPSRVLEASLILTNVTPNVRRPITLRTKAWWAQQSVQAMTSTLPTDLYYEPSYPNGKCWLWPISTTAYSVELLLRTLFADVAATDTVDLPQGCAPAVMFTLAEWLASAMGQVISPKTEQLAREARGIYFDGNDRPPRISTSDGGMGGSRRSRSRTTFNYKSRSF